MYESVKLSMLGKDMLKHRISIY